MKDSEFVNQFVVVLGVLVALAVMIAAIAGNVSGEREMNADMTEIVRERIKPVGMAHIGDVPPVTVTPSVTSDTPDKGTVQLSGETVYQQVCAACHTTGVLNSPKYGDAAAWQSRLSDIETLYASSINGKGQMPAKGGRVDLSDDSIKAAVDYMLDAVR